LAARGGVLLRRYAKLKFTLVAPAESNRYLIANRQAKWYHGKLQRDNLKKWPDWPESACPIP
jgi:hypothetical protein